MRCPNCDEALDYGLEEHDVTQCEECEAVVRIAIGTVYDDEEDETVETLVPILVD